MDGRTEIGDGVDRDAVNVDAANVDAEDVDGCSGC